MIKEILLDDFFSTTVKELSANDGYFFCNSDDKWNSNVFLFTMQGSHDDTSIKVTIKSIFNEDPKNEAFGF